MHEPLEHVSLPRRRSERNRANLWSTRPIDDRNVVARTSRARAMVFIMVSCKPLWAGHANA